MLVAGYWLLGTDCLFWFGFGCRFPADQADFRRCCLCELCAFFVPFAVKLISKSPAETSLVYFP